MKNWLSSIICQNIVRGVCMLEMRKLILPMETRGICMVNFGGKF